MTSPQSSGHCSSPSGSGGLRTGGLDRRTLRMTRTGMIVAGLSGTSAGVAATAVDEPAVPAMVVRAGAGGAGTPRSGVPVDVPGATAAADDAGLTGFTGVAG